MDIDDNINNILTSIDDTNELACMDKIYIYLEQIEEEDEAFMQLLVEKFANAEITWEQPWYQKSCSLTRPLKTDENFGEKYRTDTISKEENDKIKKNWSKFAKKFHVPDKLKCLARWKSKGKSRAPNTPVEQARRYVTAYLARGLQRTIYQVFRHIMTYFGGPVKGAYSPGEEKIMKICFKHNPGHAVTILSKILSREPRGIYKRLQQMFTGKPVKKKVKWTIPLASKFIRLLIKYSRLPMEELKNRKIDKSVWLKLEKKFDHHYVHLQSFWKESLHVQLFVKDSIKLAKLRRMVFERLRQSKYQVWTDIRWKEVVKDFPDGFTHRFLYIVTYSVIKPKILLRTKSLQELVDYAIDRLNTLRRYRNKRLKTLAFDENGELEVVRYNHRERK